MVQNEVTAMVKAPPKVIQSMRKALSVTYIVIGISYFAVAIGEWRRLLLRVAGVREQGGLEG